MTTSPQNLMVNGQVLRMIGTILSDLNDGSKAANKVFTDILTTKFDFIQSVADATRSMGDTQAMGQLVMGAVGIVGGVAGIAGGVVSIGSTLSEAADTAEISLNSVTEQNQAVVE